MGVVTYEDENPSPIPAATLYQKFIVEGDTIIPKAVPFIITSVDILQGDGGAGTIKLITFAPENGVVRTVKHKVDELDKEKLSYAYSVTEGDYITGGIESISYYMEVVPSDDGGSIVKNKTTFHNIDGTTFPEAEVQAGKERLFGLFKAVEAYILANP